MLLLYERTSASASAEVPCVLCVLCLAVAGVWRIQCTQGVARAGRRQPYQFMHQFVDMVAVIA